MEQDKSRQEGQPGSASGSRLEAEAQEQALRRKRHKQIADGIGMGLTFIVIGVVWLLVKFGYINVAIFRAIFDLWPLIFVVIGVNIIFRRFAYIGMITWILFLGAILLYGSMVGTRNGRFDFFGFDLPWSIVERANPSAVPWNFSGTTSGSFDLNDLNGIQRARVDLSMPAGSLNVGVTDQNAMSYVVPGRLYQVGSRRDGDTMRYSFKPEAGLKFDEVRQRLNYDFYLNPKAVWSLGIDAGAMESHMSLSQIPVESLVINMGAGELDLRMGNLVDQARVEINCGATSIRLEVPEGVGVSVDYKGIVADQSLARNGFVKENGIYYSQGFSQRTQQIQLVIKSAVAEIDVNFK